MLLLAKVPRHGQILHASHDADIRSSYLAVRGRPIVSNTVTSRLAKAGRPRRTAASRCLAVLAVALCAMAVVSVPAMATDLWSGSSTAGSKVYSGYQHHSAFVIATYNGGGNLPLGAGSNTFAAYSGDWNPPHYNSVTACAYAGCGANSATLGSAWVSNRNSSTHTVNGWDDWY